MIVDVEGKEIKEGSILTFDWFDCKNPIEDMRRKFAHMATWTDEKIAERINRPVYVVKRKHYGLYGEGIKDLGRGRRLYLHNYRFKYTKIINQFKNQ